MARSSYNDNLYFDSAAKFSNEEVQLRGMISNLLRAAQKAPGALHVAVWLNKPITLTFGQAKTLQEHKCKIYMRDDEGKMYYEVPDEVPKVKKVYSDPESDTNSKEG